MSNGKFSIVWRARGIISSSLHFWTGLRTSELVALEWVDIDLDAGTVSVNKGMTQPAHTAEPPKTEAGDRFVKLLPMALEALTSQKSISGSDGAVVFRNPRTQKSWTGDQPIRKTLWIPALKKIRCTIQKALPNTTYLRLYDDKCWRAHWLD